MYVNVIFVFLYFISVRSLDLCLLQFFKVSKSHDILLQNVPSVLLALLYLILYLLYNNIFNDLPLSLTIDDKA